MLAKYGLADALRWLNVDWIQDRLRSADGGPLAKLRVALDATGPLFDSMALGTALHRALEYANERHHEYATLEHLLLALLDDRDAAAVMKACLVNFDTLRKRIVEYLDNELSSLFVKGSHEATPTTGFQRVVHRAVVHVQSSGREEVTGANVLVAIFAERESHAAFFLQEQDMTRFEAVQYISHGIAKRPGMSEPKHVRGVDEDQGAEGREDGKKQPQDALNTYCVNLNKKAKTGKIDPLIGREPEVMRTIQVLCRRQKNNPLFVGDAGVGKTAIVEGLAKRIQETASASMSVARFGGEEFVVLFEDSTLGEAIDHMDFVRADFGERRLVCRDSGEPLGKISFSAGVAAMERGIDGEGLLKAADQALYRAKELGRDRVETLLSQHR